MTQLISRTYDNGQLQILMNFTNALYDPKVTVWCAVWSRGVTGPYFFKDEHRPATTVTSQHYTKMLNEFIAPKLPQNHGLWFQQDGAMAYMEAISMAALRRLFLQQVISRFGVVSLPPPSLDLTAPNFFM